jgi:hypothetical protein
MIEALGIVFGGVSRLFQHHMDLTDKQKERDHEHRMLEKQSELQDKRLLHDADMRRIDNTAAADLADLAALSASIEAQSRESVSAGGWVTKLSASIRPLLTIYHAILVYTAVKVATFYVANQNGLAWPDAMISIYGEFDRALVGSIVGFWFSDRSLRKK